MAESFGKPTGAPSEGNLVKSVDINQPSGTAVITVRTYGGHDMQYKVRTEANVNAAIAGHCHPHCCEGSK